MRSNHVDRIVKEAKKARKLLGAIGTKLSYCPVCGVLVHLKDGKIPRHKKPAGVLRQWCSGEGRTPRDAAK